MDCANEIESVNYGPKFEISMTKNSLPPPPEPFLKLFGTCVVLVPDQWITKYPLWSQMTKTFTKPDTPNAASSIC